MVEQSDRAPLLDWEDIPTSDPNQAAPSPPAPPREEDAPAEKSSQTAGRQPPTSAAAGTGWSGTTTTTTSPAATITCSPTRSVTAVVGGGDINPVRPKSELTGHRWTRPEPVGTARNVPFSGLSARDQWEEKDQIVAVFVVTFDTRSGKRAARVRKPYS